MKRNFELESLSWDIDQQADQARRAALYALVNDGSASAPTLADDDTYISLLEVLSVLQSAALLIVAIAYIAQ